MDELMAFGENTIKYCIQTLMRDCIEDIDNLNNFISNGLKDKLLNLSTQILMKKN